jgi:ArsR family transcriptional regulator
MEPLSESFKALGDPTRLRILRLVAETPLNVSELVSVVGVGQSSVSHHLGKLRNLGLVREERQGGYSYYSLGLDPAHAQWPLIQLAKGAPDEAGDHARLTDLLRQREDRRALNERLLEPGQSWSLWTGALASLLPPLDTVDFGCGTGVLSVALAKWAKSVVAVDVSASALEQARERARREGVRNITFLREDLHQLSLPPGKKDLVVLSQSLHHVEVPETVLAEAARLLKPGGRVVVLELMPHDQAWVEEQLGHKHRGFSPEKLETLLKKVGFSNLTREIHGRDHETPFRAFLLTGVKKR